MSIVVHFTALGNGSNKNSLVASWKDRHSHFSQLLSAAVAAAVSVATLHQHQGESIIFNGMELVHKLIHSPSQKCQSFSQLSNANLLPQLMSIFFFLNSNAQMPIFRWEM
jgi:hypothetical protein